MKTKSLRSERRWALIWSYVFLVIFAVFFLTPPLYMFVTSLKTSAEISAVTLPMMRNIIAITVLFSLIVTFANFDIVRILTAGGPIDQTHVFATWSFLLGIEGGDIALGASVSLFMFPILGVAAYFILRDINRRGTEA